jgi:hypothetical protein
MSVKKLLAYFASGMLQLFGFGLRPYRSRAATFLKFDNRFGALQPRLPHEVVPPRLRKLRRQRVLFGGFAASLGRAQRYEDARGGMTPPVRQGRHGKPVAAHDRPDSSGATHGAVSLRKDSQFVLRRKWAATGTVQKFRRRRRR